MNCPNKNDLSYKELVKKFGETNAMRAWVKYQFTNDGQIPSIDIAEQLLTKPNIGDSSATSEEELKAFNETWGEFKSQYTNQTDAQLERLNPEEGNYLQRKTVQDLLAYQNAINIDKDGNRTVTINGEVIPLQRAIDYLNKKLFKDSNIPQSEAVELGNQIQDLFEARILGLKTSESFDLKKFMKDRILQRNSSGQILLSQSNINQLWNIHTAYLNSLVQDGKIIIANPILYNTDKKVAGQPNVITIDSNGKIDIIDITSSANSFIKSYYREGSDVKEQYWDKKDDDSNKELAVKKLSVYTGLAEAMGFDVVDNYVFPIHINYDKDGKIKSFENEIGPKPEQSNLALNLTPFAIKLDQNESLINDINKDNYSLPKIDLKSSKNNQFIQSIAINLEEQIKLLNNTEVAGTSEQIHDLKQLRDMLKATNSVKGFNEFIEDAEKWFVKDKKDYIGAFNRALNNLKNSKDTEEFNNNFRILANYNQMAVNYSNIIEPIIKEYNLIEPTEESNTIADKLWKIKQSVDKIKDRYKDEAITTLSKDVDKSATISPEELSKINLAIDKAQKIIDNPKSSKHQIKTAKSEIKKYQELLTTHGNLKEQLQGLNVTDESMFNRLLTPMINSKSPLLSKFAVKIKNLFNGVDAKLYKELEKDLKQYDNYKKYIGKSGNNPAKFFEGMYEKVNVLKGDNLVESLIFTSKVDFNKYYTNLKKVKDEASKMSEEDAEKYLSKFFKENKIHKSTDDIDELIAEKQKLIDNGNITQGDFDVWITENLFDSNSYDEYKDYNNNIVDLHHYANTLLRLYNQFKKTGQAILFKGEFTEINPKLYRNEKYYEMYNEDNSAKNEKGIFHKYLLDKYDEKLNMLPSYQSNKLRNGLMHYIPFISKADNDRAMENGLKNLLTYKFEQATKNHITDIENVGSENRYVPLYGSYAMDVDDISKDLFTSILRFSQSAEYFNAANSIKDEAFALQDIVDEIKPLKKTSSGYNILYNTAKKLGINKYLTNPDDNIMSAYLKGFIDQNILFQHRKKEEVTLLGLTFRLDKLIDNIMRFGSFTMIGGKPLSSAALSLQMRVMLNMEAYAGQFFNMKDKFTADKYFAEYTLKGGIIKDYVDGSPKSFVGHLMHNFDFIQGDFKDKYGRTVSGNVVKRLISTDAWFVMLHMAILDVQTRVGLSMLANKKMEDGTSLLKYYENQFNTTGEIKIRQEDFELKNTMHSVLKRMHGVYNKFDAPYIEQYSLGRLMTMYRKFIVPGYTKRIKKLGYDYELGTTTEGMYRTFFRVATSQFQDMIKAAFGVDGANLTPLERANIKRTTFEFGSMLMLTAIAMGLSSIKGGGHYDPDKYALYLALRARSELAFYVNPLDAIKILRNPSTSYSMAEKIGKFAVQFFGEYSDLEYKNSGPMYNKGDNKSWHYAKQIIHSNAIDPQIAIDQMKLLGL